MTPVRTWIRGRIQVTLLPRENLSHRSRLVLPNRALPQQVPARVLWVAAQRAVPLEPEVLPDFLQFARGSVLRLSVLRVVQAALPTSRHRRRQVIRSTLARVKRRPPSTPTPRPQSLDLAQQTLSMAIARYPTASISRMMQRL